MSGDVSKDAEIRQFRRDMARVTEERDNLKNGRRLGPPVRGKNGPCYASAQEGHGRSLIGGVIPR